MHDLYEWRVVLSNERMGFRKTFTVEGKTLHTALHHAYEELKRKGYARRAEFWPIEIVRERFVRRVES